MFPTLPMHLYHTNAICCPHRMMLLCIHIQLLNNKNKFTGNLEALSLNIKCQILNYAKLNKIGLLY